LCRLHTARLLALAIVLVGDSDRADRVVIDTLVGACRGGEPPNPGGEISRLQLAAAVYQRCVAAREMRDWPQRQRMPVIRPAPLMALPDDERALVGLVLFGAHDRDLAAATLDVPGSEVVARLAAAVCALRGTMSWPAESALTDPGRERPGSSGGEPGRPTSTR
jgi:hypothetical protein